MKLKKLILVDNWYKEIFVKHCGAVANYAEHRDRKSSFDGWYYCGEADLLYL